MGHIFTESPLALHKPTIQDKQKQRKRCIRSVTEIRSAKTYLFADEVHLRCLPQRMVLLLPVAFWALQTTPADEVSARAAFMRGYLLTSYHF